jgi:ABC-type oligopeptide transport system substrate-binding subunit
MKRILTLLLGLSIFLASCGPRPQYKTREGKKKLKYYNGIPHKKHLKNDNTIKKM